MLHQGKSSKRQTNSSPASKGPELVSYLGGWVGRVTTRGILVEDGNKKRPVGHELNSFALHWAKTILPLRTDRSCNHPARLKPSK